MYNLHDMQYNKSALLFGPNYHSTVNLQMCQTALPNSSVYLLSLILFMQIIYL